MAKAYGWSAWDPLTRNTANGTFNGNDSYTEEQAKRDIREWLGTEHFGKFSVPSITVWEEPA